MKVSATLKGKVDSFGRRSIAIRIAEGTQRKFQTTDIKVNPKDFYRGRIKNSHPDHAQLNRKLLEKIMKAENTGIFQDKEVALSFSDYATSLLNAWDKQKHWDTLRHYQSSLNKFNAFLPGVALNKITPETLQRYYTYCLSIGNVQNTVWTSFKFVRLIINRAVKEGKVTQDPFLLFDMPKYKNPKRIYLSDAQIAAIEGVRATAIPEIAFAATWFLIGCYTGLRYGDMRLFDKKRNIKNGWLVIHTSKTGEPVAMPFNDTLKGFFESIAYRPLAVTNEHYNRTLKAVGKLAEIDEKLTSHVARHTFATRAMGRMIPIEYIARMLGHSSIRTTSIYAKITGHALAQQYNKLFE